MNYYYFSKQNNIINNLALEEIIYKDFNKDLNDDSLIILTYINDPCIVYGKFQNPFKEYNHYFTLKNNITTIRRISGGGAVYHDRGNLNIALISVKDKIKDLYTETVSIISKLLNLEIEISDKFDLKVDGFKFSGSAFCNKKNKVLHHFTLLLKSNLDNLNLALSNKHKANFLSKTTESRSNKTANLLELTDKDYEIDDFRKELEKNLISKFDLNDLNFDINREDYLKMVLKNKSDEWNYALNVEFEIKNNNFIIEKGIIKEIKSKNQALKKVFLNEKCYGNITIDNIIKFIEQKDENL